MSGHPEELLRGALEKIVFFECRLGQLEAELAAAREVAAREKLTAAAAREREVTLETRQAEARGDLARALSRAQELEERVRLFESERERFLSGLIDHARIAAAPRSGESPSAGANLEQADGPDLAGFIAELRSEIERLRTWKAAAQAAGIQLPEERGPSLREMKADPQPVSAVAERFVEAGRIDLAGSSALRLEAQLPSRAERSLYESSMDDLASADAASRRRAADCLRALGSKAAAPLVAAALGRERDAEVKVALLSALASLSEPSAADLAARELQDARPAVRAAALDALAALAKDGAEPRLAASLGDPSPLVRRRAVLLLGFVPGSGAEEALASALADRDAGVARAAALALSGRPTARAQAALAKALDHREAGVRRAAAGAVSRWAGEPLDAAAPAADRRRAARRIAEKLAAIDEGALRSAVLYAADEAAPAALAAAPARPAATARATATSIAASNPTSRKTSTLTPVHASPGAEGEPSAGAHAARTAVAVVDAAGGDAVEVAVVAEVRTALRGRSAEELSAVVPAGPAAVAAAVRALVARGMLAQRGPRFFMS